ncbi:MAG TPA: NADH-quinone oxidoreductase subunit N, partial [Rhodobacteraceae bacterium]|nr:NADH-quinone oxidoreductase subunit N [Paracoccaceae bacterium]
MAALIFGFYSGKENAASRILWATSAVMVAIAIWISTSAPGAYTAFNGAFVDDSFARFCKIIILLSTAAILLMGQEYMLRRTMLRFEFPVLVALSVVGMMMMVSAGGLLAFYIGLELQSLALYVIASLNRNSAKSTESGLNYFVLGALSSGILVYGASLIYGFAGSTAFSDIIQSAQGQMPVGLLLGLGFVIIGLAFKVAAPPFHMWAPDIYEGSATPVTAFFATARKMAAQWLFARVLHDVF